MPAVLPLMRAASRSSTRRRSSTPRRLREAPSIPAAGQNVACRSPAVRICVEGLLITIRLGRFCHALVYGNQVLPRICRSPTAAYEITAMVGHKSETRVFRPSGLLLDCPSTGRAIAITSYKPNSSLPIANSEKGDRRANLYNQILQALDRRVLRLSTNAG